ncbi:TetR/AcrR family transcriptional regulator [Okeania sp. SIO2G5]|uniref:TetR/AcrR family transcriptional regulator n=1 Tax=Okeania sp. SIO2G5 TaxID=2607796 RepID=UPI0013BF0853|nr:TetR/AcrR family transcriptional regulator [Okeania sp. SIO2G5]NEP76425.1 TetR/AcrR family transcriptional regulator [Okeania sp. SIO2G5]
MSKAERTKAHIISQAANLFNKKGFAGSSMADIMRATGLKKGGIYNHFGSKDELALAAFDYAAATMGARYIRAIQDKAKDGAIAQLHTVLDVFQQNMCDALIEGGCPLLNTAIESDDTHPALRERTQQAMGRWHQSIRQVVQKGVKRGELQASIDSDAVATVMIATLEGTLMMTKLYSDRQYIDHGINHLRQYVDSLSKHVYPIDFSPV